MTHGGALQGYALHGSTSYGTLFPERLAEILCGAAPRGAEGARLRQALLEMPAARLGPLAEDVGLSVADIERRLIALFGLDIAALDRLQRGF